MTWLFFALLAPAIYCIVNFIDKYIISKEVKDYKGMVIYGTIMGLFIGTIFWIFTGFPTLPLKDTLLILFSGAITIWASFLYFRVLSKDQASIVIILFQMIPLFVLVLSITVLKQPLTVKQIIGFVIILVCSLGISLQAEENKKMRFQLSNSFWIMLLIDCMWAIAAILVSMAIHANSFGKILSYESWGLGLGGLLLYIIFKDIRNSFNTSIITVRKIALIIMFLNEAIFVFAKGITFYAYSIGPTALVSIIGSTQIFFAIVYGTLLSIIAPTIFREDTTRSGLLTKASLAVLMFFGIFLIY